MRFRAREKTLTHAWISGCLHAGLLLLLSVTGWLLRVGLGPGVLVGYGIGAVVVITLSQGLYHRSLVSGGLLLAMALGPTLRGAVQWGLQGATWGLSVPVVMEGAAALSGLGLSVMVVRALYALSRAKAPNGSALTSRAQ
ncbi:hypothetical protein [Salinibacter altiplanensis]|uniref:hypothetical protein n=1 Tax=Salinibacter altiplanensis TaxID=1803181 RepID=UPI000C9F209A|nr:hypothetical protein [Salinibacter altiplanensis]